MIERRWFFEIDRQAERGSGGVHFGMKIDRGRDDEEVKAAVTRLEHGAVIAENADATCREPPRLLLLGKVLRLRIAGADQLGVAACLELRDCVVVAAGKATHADDSDADGMIHTILNLGRS